MPDICGISKSFWFSDMQITAKIGFSFFDLWPPWPLTYDVISQGGTTSQWYAPTHQVWSSSDLPSRRSSRHTFLATHTHPLAHTHTHTHTHTLTTHTHTHKHHTCFSPPPPPRAMSNPNPRYWFTIRYPLLVPTDLPTFSSIPQGV